MVRLDRMLDHIAVLALAILFNVHLCNELNPIEFIDATDAAACNRLR